MRFLKIFTLILSLLFISFTASAEVINFPACDYIGDVDDKGRANGDGVCKFNDGNVFEGTFKKNKLIKGKFTDNDNNIFYEGKIRWGRFIVYLDHKKLVRSLINVNVDTGFQSRIEMKKMTKWFEAEEFNGVYQLTKKGEMEFQQAQGGGGGDGGGGGGGGGCGG